MLAAFVAAAAFASTASAMPFYEDGWSISQTPVQADETVSITLVVKEQNLNEINRIALAVSDPTSPTYGEFLTAAQVSDLTAPTAQDMDAVTGWLRSNGIGFQVRHSNVVADLPAQLASELFSTTFHRVENYGLSLIRATDYEIPAEIQGSVSTGFGLHGLPLPPRQQAVITSMAKPAAPAKVTPSVIASTYQINGVKVSRSEKNRQAVAEFQGQFMNSSDLAKNFQDYVATYEKGTDDVVYKYIGKHHESSSGVEAELDIQYIMGPAVGIKTEFWEFPGNDFGADLNQWSSNLTTQTDVPLVHSVSYGWQGNLSQIHVKDSDVAVIDANLARMATLGMSVMISSGDSGSGYTPNPTDSCTSVFDVKKGVGVQGESTIEPGVRQQDECCDLATARQSKAWSFKNHFWQPRKNTCTLYSTVTGHSIASQTTTTGTFRGDMPAPALWASWPASSPWVTAVGATRFIGQKVGNEEMATDQFGSGGGFSKLFDQTNAPWQVKATAHYLATVAPSSLPPAGSFPPNGRGTPDVAALGEGYQVIVDGRATSVGGTSASSPAFAAMVSLLNEARLNAGKKPMGW